MYINDFDDMSDLDIIDWVEDQVALRTLLNRHCEGICYDSGTNSCLIYKTSNFKRILSILNKVVVIDYNADGISPFNRTAYFMHRDIKFLTYLREEERLDECSTSN